jgi:hypothetical protein
MNLKALFTAIILFGLIGANAQPGLLFMGDLLAVFNADVNQSKSTLASKGFKLEFNGEDYGNVFFYQWYHGRTSHHSDAFIMKYVVKDRENFDWKDDCVEYITYSEENYESCIRFCETSQMHMLESGTKDFTFTDSYLRDPGDYSIYQNGKYWIHFNAVQEADKMVYRVLIRKKPA